MPLTPNGKIDKKALATLEIEIQSSKAYVAPRNEIEEKLASIFAEVLQVEKVGIYDNFFELGGHSLLAMQLVSKINLSQKKSIPLYTIFTYPTVAGLSISFDKLTDSENIIVALEKGDNKTPIFAIHGLAGNIQQFKVLSEFLGKDQPFYAIQDTSILAENIQYTTIQDIAQRYIKLIQSVHSSGPYKILGHSFGGFIAHEIVSILQQKEPVVSLVLLDCYMPELLSSDATQFKEIKKQANHLHIQFSKKNFLILEKIYQNHTLSPIDSSCDIFHYFASEGKEEDRAKNIALWKKHHPSIHIKILQGDHFSILQSKKISL